MVRRIYPDDPSIWGSLRCGIPAGDRGDYAAALETWKPLAESGDAAALYIVGLMHARGEGVDQDVTEALRWFRQAAEQGLAEAQFSLTLSRAGAATTDEDEDEDEAEDESLLWCRKAAEQGHARAQYDLGRRYAKGRGVPRDAAQALVWCRRAAEQGQVEAMYMIGAQCAAGRGVRQDYVQAHVWLSLAAAEGNAVAAKSSKDVAQRMSEEDIAKAQRLALAH